MSTLDHDQLREEILRSLIETGYLELSTPLQLGEISLDLESVYTGPADRLDLAVIVYRPETREQGSRLYWQIQRLARALDAAGSRRTITVVAIGGIDDSRLLADLQTAARVLIVDDSLPVRRLLAPLLDLELPEAAQGALNGMAQVRAAVKGQHSAALLDIVEAAPHGVESVTATYSSWVDEAFATRRSRHE